MGKLGKRGGAESGYFDLHLVTPSMLNLVLSAFDIAARCSMLFDAGSAAATATKGSREAIFMVDCGLLQYKIGCH